MIMTTNHWGSEDWRRWAMEEIVRLRRRAIVLKARSWGPSNFLWHRPVRTRWPWSGVKI